MPVSGYGRISGIKLKSYHSEYALLTGIAACIVIFGFSVAKLDVIFSGIDTIRQYLTVNGAYIGIILKDCRYCLYQ